MVVEERLGVCRLDQRRHVERAIAEAVDPAVAVAVQIGIHGRTEAAVVRVGLSRLAGVGGSLDAGGQSEVEAAADAGAGVEMTGAAEPEAGSAGLRCGVGQSDLAEVESPKR